MKKEEAELIVDEIFSLYENHGNADYIGEPVSQLEHMCQAAQLAKEEGYDDEVVLAAFFHDIGHLCEFIMPVELMEGVGVLDHESIGQEYLVNSGFSERIAKLVKSHVEAKRFLTFKFPEYFEKLSDASKLTLQHQGGRMNAEEAEAWGVEIELVALLTEGLTFSMAASYNDTEYKDFSSVDNEACSLGPL